MKASLVSATSIAALLALEAGPAMAGAIFNLSSTTGSCTNSLTSSSCTMTFYSLPGTASTSQTATATDADTSGTAWTLTFKAAVAPFSGSKSTGTITNFNDTVISTGYAYTGATTAGTTGKSASVTATVNVTALNNTTTKSQTSTVILQGITVAPVNQVTSASPVYARVGGGGSVSSTVTVSNIGQGNLATGGPSSLSNLNGTASIAGTNWAGGPDTFSIQDKSTPGLTSDTLTYTYAPQPARGSSSPGTVTVAFTNGNSGNTNGHSSGNNAAQTVSVTLIGNTVGPVYQSSWPGTKVNTPTPNGSAPTPSSKVDWGTVAVGSNHSQLLTLANISTDLNGGDHTLTDLTIDHFTITGKNASNFNIAGAQSGTKGVHTVLAEAGGSEVVDIGFSAATAGTYGATLTLFTDEGVAFGAAGGDFFVYDLTAFATAFAVEPSSILLLSVGLGGALLARRRKTRGDAPGNNTV